ncbi:MAG: hypothetical protein JWP91_1638 [Fibrobacteres bacterium]|nr:hypothetical protein [Fibrobacterota bacterium]
MEPGSGSDLEEYRNSHGERERTRKLLALVPPEGNSALDIGARDGFFSLKLAERFAKVTALDLVKPAIVHPSIACMKGDVTALDFPDDAFDFVLCAEVLEHIPPAQLPRACAEIARVSRNHALIGVPFEQDIRIARTTCPTCGGKNPPWGHVNAFDERKIRSLFPGMRAEKVEFAGSNRDKTNALAVLLMDLAGNPFGTYDQQETCVLCGSEISPPAQRNLAQRLAGFTAVKLMTAQSRLAAPKPNWIHILFSKHGR